VQGDARVSCSTSAGFQFVVTGGWHSALSGVLASIVFVAIVFVLTNAPPAEHHRQERGPSLRILFVTFFVFLVASFLWATVAGFPTKSTEGTGGSAVPVAVQPVLAVPAAFLLSIGAALLFFAISWLVSAYADERDLQSGVGTTAVRCFRLIAWLAAVEVWIAIETATRSLAGRGWWYAPAGVGLVAVVSIPFLFADRIGDRLPASSRFSTGREAALRIALGFTGASAVIMAGFFAVVTGQPEARVLQEGHWCGQGLPWWAAIVAIGSLALFLAAVATLARALPRRADPAT
jgi:flagellin-like protein